MLYVTRLNVRRDKWNGYRTYGVCTSGRASMNAGCVQCYSHSFIYPIVHVPICANSGSYLGRLHETLLSLSDPRCSSVSNSMMVREYVSQYD